VWSACPVPENRDTLLVMAQRTNAAWVAALASGGQDQQEALSELRPFLERSALFYLRRRLKGAVGVAPDEVQSLAEDTAQEASLLVLRHLESFRGEARFLTWAAAIAVGVAMGALRRRLWRDLSLDRMPDGWQAPAGKAVAGNGWEHPHLAAQRQEMWDVIKAVVESDLTERQRLVLNLVVLRGVNAEEVAERLGISPGALYKLTHDARRKLKAGLLKRGYTTDEILAAFAATG
jgi:RNA polymerase sigma-70 factor (ECF subfamily)